jgi:phage terminase small subunit
MRGRKPKPAALLKLEKGKLYDQQAERAENEPKAVQELIPRCPPGLSKIQRKYWKNFSQILKSYGLFNAANAPILELLTVDWVLYKSCQENISKFGGTTVFVDPETGWIPKVSLPPDLDLGLEIKPSEMHNLVPMRNPYFRDAKDLEKLIMKSLGELGLSSLGLARIGSMLSNKGKPKSKMESLLD